MQSYTQQLNIKGFAKDGDKMMDYNQDASFLKSWFCLNINNQLPCQLIDGTYLKLNQTDNFQNLKPKSLTPYSTFKFTFLVS
jgi:hypothetical protein